MGESWSQEATLVGDGYVITVTRSYVDVPSIGRHVVAPGWKHVDPAGHVHTSLDTLEWVVTGTYWCDSCRDEHDEGEHRCRECGAAVEIRWTWQGGGFMEVLPGPVDARLVFDDGRGYILRDEERYLDGDGRLTADALALIEAREPDYQEPVTRVFSR